MNTVFTELDQLSDLSQLEAATKEWEASRLAELAQKALDVFIGVNFVGITDYPELPAWLSVETARSQLSFGLNTPYTKTSCQPHLFLAKLLMVDRLDALTGLDRLLAFRVIFTWQKVLTEPSVELKELISLATADTTSWQLTDDQWARYHLERADAHLHYYEYEPCEKSLEDALKKTSLSVELAGKMGKRTRFQQKLVSQLVLDTDVSKSSGDGPLEIDDDVPTACALNDDTILEKISLLDVSTEPSSLTAVQLASILALCRLERRTEHNDELLTEKCNAYLETVISARRCWSVQSAALLFRSELEKKSNRRVERACSQAELVVKLMQGIDEVTPMEKRWSRCDMVLASGLEAVWNAKVIHAEILRSLGCTSEALLIYENMELWDNVIDCYKSLGQLEKADSLIRRLLVERPSDSMLYVYLGDINENMEYYEKAIEISSDRNARARKSMGNLMLIRSKYADAYDHLRKSLTLQPIQLGVWFNAGYCAWKLEHFTDAATCYHRCVSLEPEHFEAWNNLSASYIRQGQKDRARRILQEALKFNFEHGKVWENYLLLCVDTGEFGQAIQAFHRLLDLNKRQEDDEILTILASQVLRKGKENLDEDSIGEMKQLKQDLVKLFARITASQTLSSQLWKLYADLKRPDNGDVVEFEKYIQLLERSVSSVTNKPDWYKDEETCVATLEAAVHLATERLELARLKGTEEVAKQTRSRIRMSLKPLLTLVQKEYGSKSVVSEEMKNSTTKAVEVLSKAAN